jgi:Holliday junction DNA helicase RuvA
MIFQLSGQLALILDDSIVIETSGIGYQVFIPELLKNSLSSVGSEIKVFTYHHIREDIQLLFGFETLSDKQFFLTLTTVSGVGPKGALKIMSACDITTITQAILKEDLVTLTRIPGLGKKTAERLIVELKDKVDQFHSSTPISSKQTSRTLSTDHQNDLFSALKTLGYHTEEIRRAIKKSSEHLQGSMKLEESIKVLLKHL